MPVNSPEVKAKIEKLKAAQRLKVTETFRAIALQTINYVSANAERIPGNEYGSPVLSGRFYSSITVALNTLDTSVKPVNPKGAESPYTGIKQSEYQGTVLKSTLKDKIIIGNSLPYANRLENYGYSKFKTPNGIFKVAVRLVKEKFKNAKGISVASGVTS